MSDDVIMDRPDDRKKPKIALLGEFSAGKSTLANALLDTQSSPVRVTATHVPPIWYALGDGAPLRIGTDGSTEELDSLDLTAVPMEGTAYIKVFLDTDILRLCDLIDMPGSSDPNMTSDIWDLLLPQADGAIWCTPATQAWRQTEAAIWEEVPERLYGTSVLLLTRIDKVRTQEDRARLVNRVRKETAGMFRGVFPVALLKALEAVDDADLWRACGMAAFSEAFLSIIDEIERGPVGDHAGDMASLRRTRAGHEVDIPGPSMRERVAASSFDSNLDALERHEDDPQPASSAPAEPEPAPAPSGAPVVPRRVTRAVSARSGRGRRDRAEGSLI
ncbi:hypothetical protein HKCCE3408_10655 [Rhodobacterales bacterium HKCCE3408]|nr:hypothetical protein [Rhodobacterales bacterium HKCCE3408]